MNGTVKEKLKALAREWMGQVRASLPLSKCVIDILCIFILHCTRITITSTVRHSNLVSVSGSFFFRAFLGSLDMRLISFRRRNSFQTYYFFHSHTKVPLPRPCRKKKRRSKGKK